MVTARQQITAADQKKEQAKDNESKKTLKPRDTSWLGKSLTLTALELPSPLFPPLCSAQKCTDSNAQEHTVRAKSKNVYSTEKHDILGKF